MDQYLHACLYAGVVDDVDEHPRELGGGCLSGGEHEVSQDVRQLLLVVALPSALDVLTYETVV